jgi:hypothetical protein
MESRKFSKAIVFSLVWTAFLFLLITNWEALKSLQLRDTWETIKFSGIWDSLPRNAGFVFLFCLVILVMAIILRHNRNVQIGKTQLESEKCQKHEGGNIYEEVVKTGYDPAYSLLEGNIHHGELSGNHWEWKS